MPYNEINGPATTGAISVTTTAQVVRVGGSNLSKRSVISIQPIDGDIFYGADSGVTSSTGTKIFQGGKFFLECADTLDIYVVAASGSVDTRIGEYS